MWNQVDENFLVTVFLVLLILALVILGALGLLDPLIEALRGS